MKKARRYSLTRGIMYAIFFAEGEAMQHLREQILDVIKQAICHELNDDALDIRADSKLVNLGVEVADMPAIIARIDLMLKLMGSEYGTFSTIGEICDFYMARTKGMKFWEMPPGYQRLTLGQISTAKNQQKT